MFTLSRARNFFIFLFIIFGTVQIIGNATVQQKTMKDRAQELFSLGLKYRDQNELERAVEHLRKALEADPGNLLIWDELAHTLCIINCYDEALSIYKNIFDKEASLGALYNMGNVLKYQHHIDEAIETYKKVIELAHVHEKIHQIARFALGITSLARGASDSDWLNGWAGYEWRWLATGWTKEQYANKPLWNGSDLQGKTILVMDEQGLGDTFQFIRYVKQLKKIGAHVIFMCQPALKTFLQTACDYIDEVVSNGDLMPNFDYQIHLLSLPEIFKTVEKTVPADIPYLTADLQLARYWKARLSCDTNFKIGLCWQGNSKNSTESLRQVFATRSISLKQLLDPLVKITGCSFYSLQKINDKAQLDELRNMPIHHFGDDLDGAHGRFMDTAAIMMNLDLVISVDTSVAHLAGALGVPTWILLPTPSDWRWMIKRLDTPWYPHMRLFRQQASGDWSKLLAMVAADLRKMVYQGTIAFSSF